MVAVLACLAACARTSIDVPCGSDVDCGDCTQCIDGACVLDDVCASATPLRVSGVTWPVNRGLAQDLHIEIVNSDGAPEDWVGTLTFTSSDPSAQLPAPYVLTPTEHGQVSLPSAVVFDSLGVHTLTVTAGSMQASVTGIEVTERHVFRSVGAGRVSALAIGTGNPVTIDGIAATFAAALPDDVGVGDALQYDADDDGVADALAFIRHRHDASHFIVKTATDGRPVASATNVRWQLFRAYTSFADADGGIGNLGLDATVRNFDDRSLPTDLVAAETKWSFACYADAPHVATGAPVFVQDWVTSTTYDVRIFAPSAADEVGRSQRHRGIWNDAACTMVNAAVGSLWDTALDLRVANVRVEGLQIDLGGGTGITARDAVTDGRFSANIIRGSGDNGFGIACSAQSGARVWNNLIYDVAGDAGAGILAPEQGAGYVYNNTIVNSHRGIYLTYENAAVVLKNNIAIGNLAGGGAEPGFDLTPVIVSAASVGNCTSDTSGALLGGGTGAQTVGATFLDAPSGDYHLHADAPCQGTGRVLSSDPELSFGDDFEGDERPATAWDPGADQS